MSVPPAMPWRHRAAMTALALCAAGIVRASSATTSAGNEAPATVTSREAATTPALQVTCLDLEAGRKAIVDDSAEPYFDRLTPYEMSAFTGAPITGTTRAEQIAECKRRFQQGVQAFTPDEEAAIRWCIGEIQPVLTANYPRFAAVPWKFVKLADTIEGGFPHTRGAYIVLPADRVAQLPQYKTRLLNQKERHAILLRGYGSLFIHEQTHVLQRAHPELFVPLYTKVWKFQHLAALPPGDWLAARQLLNPDGTDLRWIYPVEDDGRTRWIFPTAAFMALKEPPEFSARTMHELAVDVEQTPTGFAIQMGPDGRPRCRELREEPAYVRDFAPSHNLYHPNEIAADMFSRLVLLEQTKPETLEAKDTPLARFRTWARQTLGK